MGVGRKDIGRSECSLRHWRRASGLGWVLLVLLIYDCAATGARDPSSSWDELASRCRSSSSTQDCSTVTWEEKGSANGTHRHRRRFPLYSP